MFAGLDVGSTTAKAVLLGESGIVSRVVIETGDRPSDAGRTVYQTALQKAGIDPGNVLYRVGTGYGRVSLSFVDETVTELSCHGRGVHYLNPSVRVIIDMGGQDSKAIAIQEDGIMVEFVMNDKCAAGTGRFLDVMARVLRVELGELGPLSLRSEAPCIINSTCAVFAESEVISLLAAGESKRDIAAGLHKGIAQRVGNMTRRLSLVPDVTFVGGVAKNIGVKSCLEEFLGVSFVDLPEDPQMIGALGAAVFARERATGERHGT